MRKSSIPFMLYAILGVLTSGFKCCHSSREHKKQPSRVIEVGHNATKEILEVSEVSTTSAALHLQPSKNPEGARQQYLRTFKKPKIKFHKFGEGFHVTITTENFHINSATSQALEDYKKLHRKSRSSVYGDSKKYAASISFYLEKWGKFWQVGNPFAGLSVYSPRDLPHDETKVPFLGYIVLATHEEQYANAPNCPSSIELVAHLKTAEPYRVYEIIGAVTLFLLPELEQYHQDRSDQDNKLGAIVSNLDIQIPDDEVEEYGAYKPHECNIQSVLAIPYKNSSIPVLEALGFKKAEQHEGPVYYVYTMQ